MSNYQVQDLAIDEQLALQGGDGSCNAQCDAAKGWGNAIGSAIRGVLEAVGNAVFNNAEPGFDGAGSNGYIG